MAAPRSTVAVIVATRDRPELLARALHALAGATRPEDEIIVVDNGSRDGRTKDVADAAGVRCVRCERPGAASARNAGVAATSAPIVAVTDDDCRPLAGWTAAVERAFADPATAFVTGQVVADNGVSSPVFIADTEPRTYVWPQDPMHFGHGANSSFRRSHFEQVGGYDEMLGPGAPLHNAEDHDLFWRLLRAGWTGRFEPTAVVEHAAWRNRRDLMAAQWSYGVGTGAFAAKAWRIDRDAGRALMRARLLDEGLFLAGRLLRRGHEMPAAEQLIKLVGVLRGAAATWRYTVVDGRYVARRRSVGAGQ